ncbi:MAG: hypothetical protein Tsb002_35600 [Wenzhouxiangellaceae bacterium]
MMRHIGLFLIMFCSQISTSTAESQPFIELSSQEAPDETTIINVSISSSELRGVQFDILIPTALEENINTSNCTDGFQNITSNNLLISCHIRRRNDNLRLRYIITTLDRSSLPEVINLPLQLMHQDIVTGSHSIVIDPCTSLYTDAHGNPGKFAIDDLNHMIIISSDVDNDLIYQTTDAPWLKAKTLWSDFSAIERVGERDGRRIRLMATEWNGIPRFIRLTLPGESDERMLAVNKASHIIGSVTKNACDIASLDADLKTLGKDEFINFQAEGHSTYLNLTYTASGIRGFISGGSASFELNVLNGEYWLLTPSAHTDEPEIASTATTNDFQSGFVCPPIPRFDPIDIVVFYTAAANASVAQNGGVIEDEILTLIAQTNSIIDNSLSVPTTLNPIAIVQTDYVEPSNNLNTIIFEFGMKLLNEGLLESYNADIPALIVDHSNINSCSGVAVTPTNIDAVQSLQNDLLSVSTVQCINSPRLTFSHEVGHTLGGQHNEDGTGFIPPPPPPFDNTTAPFPWSYGHWVVNLQTNEGFSSVVAQPSACSATTGFDCTVAPYFSNPAAIFMGQTMGIPDTRDNSRGFDCFAPHIALRRDVPERIFTDGFESMIP